MTMALPPGLIARIPVLTAKRKAAEKYGPIGIDFSANGIRLVQFCSRGDKLELSASALIPVSDQERASPRLIRSLLRKNLRKHGFVGHEVVTCLPPDDVKIMMISYLHQTGKQDEELIVQRIAERIEGDIHDYVIDFMMVRPQARDGQERSALVAMAPRDTVLYFLEQLRKSGLTVRVLEIESTAVRRLVLVRHGHGHKSNLITVSMGHTQTYITVLSGRRLIYERDIDFGEQQLIELLRKELELNEHEVRTLLVRDDSQAMQHSSEDAEDISVTDALYSVVKPLFMELVEDINRAQVYAASETRGMPVEHVYLTNLVATWRGIESFVDSLIDVPVSVLVPFAGFGNPRSLSTEVDPRGALAAGMALHEMTEAG